ncbi:MAG: hypothetical protein WBA39_13785 [Rivularia sp. (in: cyanobacteria)]
MKTQSKYSHTQIYKIQQIKCEIQYLRKKLLEIEREIKGIKQDRANYEPNKLIIYSQTLPYHNDDSNTQLEEKDNEKLWGNYILLILLAFYLVIMSFL